MKILLKSALMAGMLIAAPQVAMAAKDTSTTGTPISGLAYADLEAAAANSAASKTAAEQRKVTYKAQIDQYNSRSQALQAQIKPLVDKFNADRAAANPNQASLQQQAASIQQMQKNAQQELNNIIKPVVYSEAYVGEQIDAKMEQAVRNAMAAKKVTMLLKPEATLLASASYDITDDVTAQLNALLPSAQIVPPAGWEPRQIREARAQQQGGEAAAPASSAQPTGR